jgi:hypothetical protein
MPNSQSSTAKSKKLRVLALDPGKNEFAYCYLIGTKIKKVGMFKRTMKDMKEQRFMFEVSGFVREYEKFMGGLGKIDFLVIERYMARPGKGGGSVSEAINVMLGIIARYCHRKGIHIIPISSAQWKNRFSSRHGGDTQAERYGFPVSKTKKTEPVLDHEFDAIGIGHWFCECRPLTGSKAPSLNLMKLFRKRTQKLWTERLHTPTNGKPRKAPQKKANKPTQPKPPKPKTKRTRSTNAKTSKARAGIGKKQKAKSVLF